jgi:hypothetical protein
MEREYEDTSKNLVRPPFNRNASNCLFIAIRSDWRTVRQVNIRHNGGELGSMS